MWPVHIKNSLIVTVILHLRSFSHDRLSPQFLVPQHSLASSNLTSECMQWGIQFGKKELCIGTCPESRCWVRKRCVCAPLEGSYETKINPAQLFLQCNVIQQHTATANQMSVTGIRRWISSSLTTCSSIEKHNGWNFSISPRTNTFVSSVSKL